ncbi:MAG: T9SS type A sorting domain-containing protein [Flavobacteriales bacterium]|nr:T9SS type A sorting domain-containing protein [Flavobacteriales bacterium]
MKKLTKLLTLLLSVAGINYASAQCSAGEVAVTIDITTDTWGYETYWEMVPSGNPCGTGALFTGGNTVVGCGGEGLKAASAADAGAYASSTTINLGPFCIVDGTMIDLIIIDDWGDSGNTYDVSVDGTVVVTAAADDVSFMAASSFDDLSVANQFGEYALIPQGQASTLDVIADVTNGGTNNLTDAVLICNIYEGGVLVNTLTSAATAINAAATTTINLGTHNISAVESYAFEYVVSSAAVGVDANTSNDSALYVMATTDSTYARDNGQTVHGPASIGAGAAANGKLGMLYTLPQADVLTSCDFMLYPKNWGTTPQDINVEVYDVVNGLPTTLLGTSNTISLVGDSSASLLYTYIQLDFPGGLFLTDDSVAVMITEPDTSLSLVMMTDVYTPGTGYLYWDANGWAAVEAFTAYFQKPYFIRPAFGPVCSLTPSTISGNNVTTNGGSNGDATVVTNGGQGNITYVWDNGMTTASISGLIAGVYVVTVTDDIAVSCTDVASVTITEPAACLITVTSTVDSCLWGVGTATVSSSGGVTPFAYVWSTGDEGTMISDLSAGIYAVTASDSGGCEAIGSVTVSSTAPITQLVVTSTDATSCTVTDGTASVAVTGGTTPYTYTWWDGGLNIVAQTTTTITGLAANLYGVGVEDANGCYEENSVAVNAVGAPSITITNTSVTCNNGADGSVSVTETGGTSPYTYSWLEANSGATYTDATITGPPAGDYLVTVSDAGSCSAFGFTVIDEPDMLEADADVYNSTCNGTSDGIVDFWAWGGTTSYTYEWSNGETTQGVSGLAQGTYDVTVTDANTCSAIWSYTITEPSILAANVSVTDETFAGANDGTAMSSPTGGTAPYSYLWNNSGTDAALSGLTPNTYSVIVTDDNGCIANGSITVSTDLCNGVTILPNATGTDETAAGANDGAASAGAIGGLTPYTYDWGAAGTGSSISGLAPATYTVTATDANGCTGTDSYTVNVYDPCGSVTIAGTTSTTDESAGGANDGTATVVATGGTTPYTYMWSGSGGAGATTVGVTGGSYTVTITDANGCTSTATATISSINGIAQLSDGAVVSLFPNPNNGNFVVNISKDGNYTVVIRNVIGQTIENVALNGTKVEISLNSVDAGIYFVTIQGEGFEKTEKVIIK